MVNIYDGKEYKSDETYLMSLGRDNRVQWNGNVLILENTETGDCVSLLPTEFRKLLKFAAWHMKFD